MQEAIRLVDVRYNEWCDQKANYRKKTGTGPSL